MSIIKPVEELNKEKPEPFPCRSCVHGQHTLLQKDLTRIRFCRRLPPSIPFPGPGGAGVVFVQPNVAEEGSCSEWKASWEALAKD